MSVEYSEILEHISESFIVMDENLKIEFFNKKSENIFENIKKDISFTKEIGTKDDESELLRFISVLNDNTFENSNQNLIFSFNKKYLLTNFKKLSNSKILVLFSYFDDNYFKKVLNSSNASFVLVDPNKKDMPCIFANDNFYNYTGYSKEEVLGKNLGFLKVDESDRSERNKITNALSNNKSVVAVLKNKKRSGEIYYNKVSIAPLINKDTNRLQFFLGVQNDITKQLNETFVLNTIYNSVHSMILVIQNGKIKRANDIFLKTFGISTVEEFHKKYESFCETFIVKEDKKDSITPIMFGLHWAKYIQIHPKKVHKVYIKTKGDIEKVYQVRVNYSKDLNEEVVTLNNITQIEEREELLKKQSKFAAMGEMISMIAHQWRQPLTTLALTIDKLNILSAMNRLNSSTFNKNYKKISETILHMSDTIEDFRTFFDNKESIKKVTIKELIMKPYGLNKTIMDNRQIKTSIDFNDLEDEVIYLNSSRFSQVIMNLLKNAIDEFDSKNILNPMINISTFKKYNTIIIHICDNAGGIHEGIIDKIFDPYFSTKSKNGTGIGLYMSKVIIEEQLYGNITAQNYADGAQFTIKIPIKKEE